jgi:hypothetical protein
MLCTPISGFVPQAVPNGAFLNLDTGLSSSNSADCDSGAADFYSADGFFSSCGASAIVATTVTNPTIADCGAAGLSEGNGFINSANTSVACVYTNAGTLGVLTVTAGTYLYQPFTGHQVRIVPQNVDYSLSPLGAAATGTCGDFSYTGSDQVKVATCASGSWISTRFLAPPSLATCKTSPPTLYANSQFFPPTLPGYFCVRKPGTTTPIGVMVVYGDNATTGVSNRSAAVLEIAPF